MVLGRLPSDCPVPSCKHRDPGDGKRILEHVRLKHRREETPDDFIKKFNLHVCDDCHQVFRQLNRHFTTCPAKKSSSRTPVAVLKGTTPSARNSASKAVTGPSIAKTSRTKGSVATKAPLRLETPPLATCSFQREKDCATNGTSSEAANTSQRENVTGHTSGRDWLNSMAWKDLSTTRSIESLPRNLCSLFLECCRKSFHLIIENPASSNSWKLFICCLVLFSSHWGPGTMRLSTRTTTHLDSTASLAVVCSCSWKRNGTIYLLPPLPPGINQHRRPLPIRMSQLKNSGLFATRKGD